MTTPVIIGSEKIPDLLKLIEDALLAAHEDGYQMANDMAMPSLKKKAMNEASEAKTVILHALRGVM